MTIEQTYSAEGGNQYWEVCVVEDRHATVRRSEGTGNYYIIENLDGSTIHDGFGAF